MQLLARARELEAAGRSIVHMEIGEPDFPTAQPICDAGIRAIQDGRHFYTPALGICQWFHFEDPRLDAGVAWLKRMGVKQIRTGLSWADWQRPDAARWFDRLVSALEPFDVTATFCFTPEDCGLRPHHTSPPRDIGQFADFCSTMVRRYAT